jgi:uncharacterized membrane protein
MILAPSAFSLPQIPLESFVPPTPPPPEALHVLVVHSPIGLLLVAPLFVLLAMLFRRSAGWAALIILVLGTAGAWAAVQTGVDARDMVEDGPDAMWQVLEKHEELAIAARNVFTVVTVVYAFILGWSFLSEKISRLTVWIPLNLVFLAALLAANLLLANAAHQGGHLVHLYGVHAALGIEPPAAERAEVPAVPETATPEPAPPETMTPAPETAPADQVSAPAAPETAAAPTAEPAPAEPPPVPSPPAP